MTMPSRRPDNYPNPYFHNPSNFPSITFIWFAMTSKGRVSRNNTYSYEQFRIKIKPGGKFENYSYEQLVEYARANVNLDRLRKGYFWSDMYVQDDTLDYKKMAGIK